jgi:hypothetical protein
MKYIFFFFLIPIMVLGQPIEQLKKYFVSNEFEMDFAFHEQMEDELNAYEFKKSKLSRSVLTDTPLFNTRASAKPINLGAIPQNSTPMYLTTFSISSLYSVKNHSVKPQKRLNHLLAIKDVKYPKENTLLPSLNPVRYKNLGFGGAENMTEGFGPKIKF